MKHKHNLFGAETSSLPFIPATYEAKRSRNKKIAAWRHVVELNAFVSSSRPHAGINL